MTTTIIIGVLILAVIAASGVYFYFRICRAVENVEGFTVADGIAAWGVFANVATTVTAIVAGLIAFVRYVDQRQLELDNRKLGAAQKDREFNLRIYTEAKLPDDYKRILFSEVTDLAATIASLEELEGPTARITTERFQRLYLGELVLHEENKVASAMVEFRKAVKKWKKTKSKPTVLKKAVRKNGGTKLRKVDLLEDLALKLANACRGELEAGAGADTKQGTMSSPEVKSPQ